MKRIIFLVSTVLIISLCLVSCGTYHYIKAEDGSKWGTKDKILSFSIIDGGSAEGTLKIEQENIQVIAYFGPGKKDFIFYDKSNETDGDAYLFRGDYYYDSEKEIITFKVKLDKIGINRQEIVLYKIENDSKSTN